jgi:hypothetical protein
MAELHERYFDPIALLSEDAVSTAALRCEAYWMAVLQQKAISGLTINLQLHNE